MPYDEVAYQRIEEEEEEKKSAGEKIKGILRNESFEMCLCLTLGFLVLGIGFHFGVSVW